MLVYYNLSDFIFLGKLNSSPKDYDFKNFLLTMNMIAVFFVLVFFFFYMFLISSFL